MSYNVIMRSLATRWDAQQPRNEETGVLVGAEAFDLGPADADTAVLLVHGFIGGSNNFAELPDRLADAGYRVRALRLPGHGTSPLELARTNPADMLNHVLREVRLLRESHGHVFLIGHSMGGSISLLTSTMVELDGLVLAGAHFKTTRRWWYLLPVEQWSAIAGRAIRWVYKPDAFIQINREEVKHDIVSYRFVPTQGGAAAMGFAARARDPAVLDMVACPVLVLHGRDDSAASPAAAQHAFDAMASEDKSLVWLDNSDHHIFWDYDREYVYAQIQSFIEGHTEE